MTTTNWNSIKNSIDASDIAFACLSTANFHYGLFEKLFEGLSPLSIFDIPKDPIVGTYYRQYRELVVSPSTFNCNHYNKDIIDTDEKNDGQVADNRVADKGVVDNKTVDNNND